MALHRPRKGQKSSGFHDDPSWDNWEEPVLIDRPNQAPRRRTSKKNAAVAASDMFGPDGFGDSWNKLPVQTFDCDSDEGGFQWQKEFCSPSDDWGNPDLRAARRAEVLKRREDVIEKAAADLAAFKEREAKRKVEAERKAAASAVAVWNREVDRANDAVALAKPVQALNILYSLSLDNEVVKYIDEQEKKNVQQMYTALYNHYDLQKPLSVRDRSSSETDENSSDERTIGGDTVKANRSNSEREWDGEDSEIETQNTDATVVVDRLPTHRNSETNESSSTKSTIGGDTVKRSSSNHRSTAEDEEASEFESVTAVKLIETKSVERRSINLAKTKTNWNQTGRSKRKSDGDEDLHSQGQTGNN